MASNPYDRLDLLETLWLKGSANAISVAIDGTDADGYPFSNTYAIFWVQNSQATTYKCLAVVTGQQAPGGIPADPGKVFPGSIFTYRWLQAFVNSRMVDYTDPSTDGAVSGLLQGYAFVPLTTLFPYSGLPSQWFDWDDGSAEDTLTSQEPYDLRNRVLSVRGKLYWVNMWGHVTEDFNDADMRGRYPAGYNLSPSQLNRLFQLGYLDKKEDPRWAPPIESDAVLANNGSGLYPNEVAFHHYFANIPMMITMADMTGLHNAWGWPSLFVGSNGTAGNGYNSGRQYSWSDDTQMMKRDGEPYPLDWGCFGINASSNTVRDVQARADIYMSQYGQVFRSQFFRDPFFDIGSLADRVTTVLGTFDHLASIATSDAIRSSSPLKARCHAVCVQSRRAYVVSLYMQDNVFSIQVAFHTPYSLWAALEMTAPEMPGQAVLGLDPTTMFEFSDRLGPVMGADGKSLPRFTLLPLNQEQFMFDNSASSPYPDAWKGSIPARVSWYGPQVYTDPGTQKDINFTGPRIAYVALKQGNPDLQLHDWFYTSRDGSSYWVMSVTGGLEMYSQYYDIKMGGWYRRLMKTKVPNAYLFSLPSSQRVYNLPPELENYIPDTTFFDDFRKTSKFFAGTPSDTTWATTAKPTEYRDAVAALLKSATALYYDSSSGRITFDQARFRGSMGALFEISYADGSSVRFTPPFGAWDGTNTTALDLRGYTGWAYVGRMSYTEVFNPHYGLSGIDGNLTTSKDTYFTSTQEPSGLYWANTNPVQYLKISDGVGVLVEYENGQKGILSAHNNAPMMDRIDLTNSARIRKFISAVLTQRPSIPATVMSTYASSVGPTYFNHPATSSWYTGMDVSSRCLVLDSMGDGQLLCHPYADPKLDQPQFPNAEVFFTNYVHQNPDTTVLDCDPGLYYDSYMNACVPFSGCWPFQEATTEAFVDYNSIEPRSLVANTDTAAGLISTTVPGFKMQDRKVCAPRCNPGEIMVPKSTVAPYTPPSYTYADPYTAGKTYTCQPVWDTAAQKFTWNAFEDVQLNGQTTRYTYSCPAPTGFVQPLNYMDNAMTQFTGATEAARLKIMDATKGTLYGTGFDPALGNTDANTALLEQRMIDAMTAAIQKGAMMDDSIFEDQMDIAVAPLVDYIQEISAALQNFVEDSKPYTCLPPEQGKCVVSVNQAPPVACSGSNCDSYTPPPTGWTLWPTPGLNIRCENAPFTMIAKGMQVDWQESFDYDFDGKVASQRGILQVFSAARSGRKTRGKVVHPLLNGTTREFIQDATFPDSDMLQTNWHQAVDWNKNISYQHPDYYQDQVYNTGTHQWNNVPGSYWIATNSTNDGSSNPVNSKFRLVSGDPNGPFHLLSNQNCTNGVCKDNNKDIAFADLAQHVKACWQASMDAVDGPLGPKAKDLPTPQSCGFTPYFEDPEVPKKSLNLSWKNIFRTLSRVARNIADKIKNDIWQPFEQAHYDEIAHNLVDLAKSIAKEMEDDMRRMGQNMVRAVKTGNDKLFFTSLVGLIFTTTLVGLIVHVAYCGLNQMSNGALKKMASDTVGAGVDAVLDGLFKYVLPTPLADAYMIKRGMQLERQCAGVEDISDRRSCFRAAQKMQGLGAVMMFLDTLSVMAPFGINTVVLKAISSTIRIVVRTSRTLIRPILSARVLSYLRAIKPLAATDAFFTRQGSRAAIMAQKAADKTASVQKATGGRSLYDSMLQCLSKPDTPDHISFGQFWQQVKDGTVSDYVKLTLNILLDQAWIDKALKRTGPFGTFIAWCISPITEEVQIDLGEMATSAILRKVRLLSDTLGIGDKAAVNTSIFDDLLQKTGGEPGPEHIDAILNLKIDPNDPNSLTFYQKAVIDMDVSDSDLSDIFADLAYQSPELADELRMGYRNLDPNITDETLARNDTNELMSDAVTRLQVKMALKHSLLVDPSMQSLVSTVILYKRADDIEAFKKLQDSSSPDFNALDDVVRTPDEQAQIDQAVEVMTAGVTEELRNAMKDLPDQICKERYAADPNDPMFSSTTALQAELKKEIQAYIDKYRADIAEQIRKTLDDYWAKRADVDMKIRDEAERQFSDTVVRNTLFLSVIATLVPWDFWPQDGPKKPIFDNANGRLIALLVLCCLLLMGVSLMIGGDSK